MMNQHRTNHQMIRTGGITYSHTEGLIHGRALHLSRLVRNVIPCIPLELTPLKLLVQSAEDDLKGIAG